ncbi:MAG: DEAD/DEAH box helicase, partial [Acidimicrobiia bacterium]
MIAFNCSIQAVLVVSAVERAELVPSFQGLGISQELTEALALEGIVTAFPIQALTIPDALDGRDICGKAKTGSGKTLAFGLPMLEMIGAAEPRRPRGLVVVPTRELAAQVAATLGPLGRVKGKRVLAVYGGTSIRDQVSSLAVGVEVIVATPARLIDLLERGTVHLDSLEMLVIDEADEMADLGF